MDADALTRALARIQGWFYVLTGIWPIAHLRSFLAVTGPKTDTWLVQTVGGLLAVVGLALVLVARRNRIEFEWWLVGAGVPLVLAIIDVVFVARDVIPPIYLADAAAELLLALAWLGCALKRRILI